MQPQLPQDRKLAQVSREARYTFVLTWTIADDEGFFRAEPRQLLGQLYPFDEDLEGRQLEAWLSELAAIGVLRWRQTRDGARVGEVVNWRRHQKIDRPSRSFLASEIDKLAEDSSTPREGEAGPSLLESRVLSPESRVLSLESGKAAAAQWQLLRGHLQGAGREALDGYARAARHPDAFTLAVLAESPEGIHAKAGVTWEILGLALAEMRAAGKDFAPVVLRAFCRRLTQSDPLGPSGRVLTDGERMRADAERKAREGATA